MGQQCGDLSADVRQDRLGTRRDVRTRGHAEEQHAGHDAGQGRGHVFGDLLAAAKDGRDGLFGLRGDGEGFAVMGSWESPKTISRR